MRLHLEHEVIIVREADHARIVGEHAYADVLFTRPGPDVAGRALDIGLEERRNEFTLPVFAVVDLGAEYLVLAVLRPGLCEALQLDICELFTETCLGPYPPYLRIGYERGDRLHFFEIQGQGLFS